MLVTCGLRLLNVATDTNEDATVHVGREASTGPLANDNNTGEAPAPARSKARRFRPERTGGAGGDTKLPGSWPEPGELLSMVNLRAVFCRKLIVGSETRVWPLYPPPSTLGVAREHENCTNARMWWLNLRPHTGSVTVHVPCLLVITLAPGALRNPVLVSCESLSHRFETP